MNKKRINCYTCRHFYITWDENYPKGCMAFGFKTKYFPHNVVISASGMKCLGYQLKKK